MMNPLLIIETGHAFEEVIENQADFSDLIIKQLPVQLPTIKCDVITGETLPNTNDISGVILTGSHSMVTDHEAWSEMTADWLREAQKANLPILGICYGHQLLAYALGGEAGYNKNGVEVGTKDIYTTDAVMDDPIFQQFPSIFKAHATHAQSALTLPKDAIILAKNDHEKHHAFRIGQHIWGVQFHPEFNENVMQAYIKRRASANELDEILKNVQTTPISTALLHFFGNYVLSNSEH